LAGNIFREFADVYGCAISRLLSSDIQVRIGAACSAIYVWVANECSANGMPTQQPQPDPKRESRHFRILRQHYPFGNSCIGVCFS
jgi:hypothetical protein